MSYILDALRRADSERERGSVPNIHAKPVPESAVDADDDDAALRRSQPLVWAVVVLSVLLIGALVWQFTGRDRAEAVVVVPATPAPAPAAPLETAPLVATPAMAPPPLAPVEPPRPKALPTPAPSIAKGAATAPKEPAAESRVHALAELPDNIRRELPQLAVGGAMYSQNVASRMLILNGQVFHEGDTVAPNLVLEQIKLKTAVLAYKGYRYSIGY